MNTQKISFYIAVFIIVTRVVSAEIPYYNITDLGTLGGSLSSAEGINDNGQVVGLSYTETGVQHAFLYDGTEMSDLGTLGGSASGAFDINNNGMIVGFSDTGIPDTQHAFLYDGTEMIDLGTLGRNSYAWSINNNGQVVGKSQIGVNLPEHAFLFNGTKMIDLADFLGEGNSDAQGINDSGQVVGGMVNAFMYNGTEMIDLGTLGGDVSKAYDISNSGLVVGWSFLSGNVAQHAFLYDGTEMIDLGTLGGDKSYAYAVNDSGQIVGDSEYGNRFARHAFYYDDKEGMLDLNNLIPLDSGWVLKSATDINSLGQIVGYGNYNGEQRAFLITPVPEPTTISLLALGAFFAGRKRRK